MANPPQEKKDLPKKPRRLTLKQQGFIKDYLETKNATEAARRNYDTTDYGTMRMIGSDNLTKPNIQKELEICFAESGLTKKKFTGIIASKILSVNSKDHKGYCMLAADMNGWYAPKKSEVKQETTLKLNKDEENEYLKLRAGMSNS